MLLDTHALLWWFSGRGLSATSATAIGSPLNEIVVSAASVWEVAIKVATGRLDAPVDQLVSEVPRLGFAPLPVVLEHCTAAARLPLHHRDPFDRMLVAQAQLERLTIVTRDPAIAGYDVKVMPA